MSCASSLLSSRVAFIPAPSTNHRKQRHHYHRRGNAVRVYAARPPSGEDGKANKKQLYEVQVITPPKRCLGMHKFQNNISCGETIELRKRYFVVGTRGGVRGAGDCGTPLSLSLSPPPLFNSFIHSFVHHSSSSSSPVHTSGRDHTQQGRGEGKKKVKKKKKGCQIISALDLTFMDFFLVVSLCVSL